MITTTEVKLRRGSAAEVSVFTPNTGELVIDLTNHRPIIGDNLTVGGFTGALLTDVNTAIFNLSGYVNSNAGAAGISALSGSLFQTGAILYSYIVGTSGSINHNDGLNLSGSLFQTGSSLASHINSLSGNLILTGQTLYNDIIGLSGLFNTTGITLQTEINTLTANLTQTGITLFNRDLSISGALASQISANAAGVGNINGLSGSITLAGAPLGNIFITNSGNTIFVSGNGIATTTNLTLTGQTLYNDIVGLSGVVNSKTISNIVYTTGTQIISGSKMFSNLSFSGNVNGSVVSILNDANGQLLYSDGENENIFIGEAAGGSHGVGGYGSSNVTLGNETMQNIASANNSVAIGYQALASLTNGDDNIAVGLQSLNSLTIGSDNLALGTSAGVNLTGGSNNILIGNFGLGSDTSITRIGSIQTDIYLAGVISGDGSHIINLNSIYITGNTLDGKNRILSGNWNVSALYISGSPVITAAQTGGFGGGGSNAANTGAYLFTTPATSGLKQQFIFFPSSLGNSPYVIPSMTNLIGNESILVQTSGITSSGYWAQYSNWIDNTGYLLTTLASISTQTGLATTVIVNGGSSILTVSKITGNFNIQSNNFLYLVDTSSAPSTGTFPNASGLLGYKFTVKDWKGNASVNNIVLTGINNETFDGMNSMTYSSNFLAYDFISDGSNWGIY